jgi:hypothetical protein
MVREMMTTREAAVSGAGSWVRASSAVSTGVSTFEPEMLPWIAAQYFYSMADRVMLV